MINSYPRHIDHVEVEPSESGTSIVWHLLDAMSKGASHSYKYVLVANDRREFIVEWSEPWTAPIGYVPGTPLVQVGGRVLKVDESRIEVFYPAQFDARSPSDVHARVESDSRVVSITSKVDITIAEK